MRLRGNFKVFLLLAAIGLGAGSCTNHNEEELYGKAATEGCPTPVGNMTYAVHIKPLLQQHCYSCHSSGFPAGSIVLDTYQGVKQQMDNGRLLLSVRHGAGISPMPQGAPKLPACDIARIAKWAADGALNN